MPLISAQRAHANFTENLTPFLGALLISGIQYPLFAASLGAVWSAARVAFAVGYTSSGPQGRVLYVSTLLFFFNCTWMNEFLLTRDPRGSVTASLCDMVLKLAAARATLGYVLGW